MEFVPNAMDRHTRKMLDHLSIFSLHEDPDRWERLIETENQRSTDDAVAAQILRSVYWESDRENAFDRFRNSLDFRSTLKLLKNFGVTEEKQIVEIGGGSGFLAWALTQSDYRSVSLLEPNAHHITGTGYLQSRADAADLTIENSLEKFYADERRYDVVITRNCVHHFPNITFVAAAIRQKLKPGGRWIMIREPLVESSLELYRFLQGHPYSQAYGVYEFAFPATHYVDSLELAGFRLSSLIPTHYANNALSLYAEVVGGRRNRFWTSTVDRVIRRAPGLTRTAFLIERALRSLVRTDRGCFTKPQLMVFDRQELGPIDEGAVWYRPTEPKGLSAEVDEHPCPAAA